MMAVPVEPESVAAGAGVVAAGAGAPGGVLSANWSTEALIAPRAGPVNDDVAPAARGGKNDPATGACWASAVAPTDITANPTIVANAVERKCLATWPRPASAVMAQIIACVFIS